MKLEPTLDRLTILREDRENTTKGGIIIPGKAQEESNFGKVMAIGPGGFNQDGSRRPINIKVGDRVFFTDYHITPTGGNLVIVDEEDVLAIVKG